MSRRSAATSARTRYAGRVREAQGDVVDTGLLAVQDAEAVRDVQVGQRGELVGEHAPRRVVLAGLPCVEPQVLEHDQLAGAHRGHGRPRGWSGRVGGQLDRPAEQLAEPGRDRAQRVPRVRLARRQAEMSADDHLGVAVQQGGQGRERGPDPAVIGDAAAVERHVEIDAHQHALACNHEVVDCLHRRSPSTRHSKNQLRALSRTPDPSVTPRPPGGQGRWPPLWGTFVGSAVEPGYRREPSRSV